MRSPLASQFPAQDKGHRKRKDPLFGVVLHTSGSSIVERAIKAKADPLEFAAAYYAKPDSYGCHYVIGWDGAIIQVAAEDEIIYHVGRTKDEIAAFKSGKWKKLVSPATLEHWQRAWKDLESPLEIGPALSINDHYVGVEMTPLVKGVEWEIARWPVGGKFTRHQHESARALCRDVAKRYGFPFRGRHRVIGHEDANPLSRANSSGGWDPGARRRMPQFDWEEIFK